MKKIKDLFGVLFTGFRPEHEPLSLRPPHPLSRGGRPPLPGGERAPPVLSAPRGPRAAKAALQDPGEALSAVQSVAAPTGTFFFFYYSEILISLNKGLFTKKDMQTPSPLQK